MGKDIENTYLYKGKYYWTWKTVVVIRNEWQCIKGMVKVSTKVSDWKILGEAEYL